MACTVTPPQSSSARYSSKKAGSQCRSAGISRRYSRSSAVNLKFERCFSASPRPQNIVYSPRNGFLRKNSSNVASSVCRFAFQNAYAMVI